MLCNMKFCVQCYSSSITVTNNLHCRMGFNHRIDFKCNSCNYVSSKNTSPEAVDTERGKSGRNVFEINVRTALSFREIGKGHNGIKTFSRCMNMHTMSEPSFRNINQKLYEAYEKAANHSMEKAAVEARTDEIVPNIYTCRVSLDGS